MEAISGVFKARKGAEDAVEEVRKSGIAADKITLLTPGTVGQVDKEMQSGPVDSAQQPGIGKGLGALAGGGVGIAGGALLVALVPGLGPITAVGLLGAAILGAAGATIGATVGNTLEKSTTTGLPEDEIFVYEDALRQGRSGGIVMADNTESATLVRDQLKMHGAESVDAAREQWWIGLRDSEESHYTKSGKSFTEDEKYYRLGFEAALHAKRRCVEFDQVSGEMNAALEGVQRKHPGGQLEEAFRRDYE